jgi:phage terminase large subunit
MQTTPAYKSIPEGIEAVAARLRAAGDGRPRLFALADALVARDEALVEAKRPTCFLEEIDGYIWSKGIDGRSNKEVPLDVDNHSMDCCRYAVCGVDEVGVRKAKFYF